MGFRGSVQRTGEYRRNGIRLPHVRIPGHIRHLRIGGQYSRLRVDDISVRRYRAKRAGRPDRRGSAHAPVRRRYCRTHGACRWHNVALEYRRDDADDRSLHQRSIRRPDPGCLRMHVFTTPRLRTGSSQTRSDHPRPRDPGDRHVRTVDVRPFVVRRPGVRALGVLDGQWRVVLDHGRGHAGHPIHRRERQPARTRAS